MLLVLSPQVIGRFEDNRQSHISSKEAGGQLFARFVDESIIVEYATGPYPCDKRKRCLFVPNRKREQQDIDAFYDKNLHYVGTWHTHPEMIPTPSCMDITNTQTRFLKSEHVLQSFVAVIVGLAPFPSGLFVGLVDATRFRQLPHV